MRTGTLATLILIVSSSACSPSAPTGASGDGGSAYVGEATTPGPVAQRLRLPDPDRDWDYQIGGVSRPAPSVGTVVRDRGSTPRRRAYNVCYVNAFQTQPDERSFWRDPTARWRLVLKRQARPVVDGAWGEFVLDTRSAGKRRHLARIIGRWLVG